MFVSHRYLGELPTHEDELARVTADARRPVTSISTCALKPSDVPHPVPSSLDRGEGCERVWEFAASFAVDAFRGYLSFLATTVREAYEGPPTVLRGRAGIAHGQLPEVGLDVLRACLWFEWQDRERWLHDDWAMSEPDVDPWQFRFPERAAFVGALVEKIHTELVNEQTYGWPPHGEPTPQDRWERATRRSYEAEAPRLLYEAAWHWLDGVIARVESHQIQLADALPSVGGAGEMDPLAHYRRVLTNRLILGLLVEAGRTGPPGPDADMLRTAREAASEGRSGLAGLPPPA